MKTTFFNTIFDNSSSITLTDFLLCLGVSLLNGLFLAMGAGLMAGMGYLAYAVLFALILGLVSLCLHAFGIGSNSKPDGMTLRITRQVPIRKHNYNWRCFL